MISPLTTALLKIFVKGFYRVHAGLILFFLLTLIMYGFFIEVLNQTHLAPAERIFYNLILVLSIISSPAMVVFVFILWLAFTMKSWTYILVQLLIPENQFLFYSGTALSKVHQFKSWFIVQLAISIPMIIYGLFSVAVGLIYGYYSIPASIILYVLLLSSISALLYVRFANRPINISQKSFVVSLVRGWNKPFFSLFLYHAFDQHKVTLISTKLLSYSIIAGILYLLADVHEDFQMASLITLGIITTHAILLYQSYRFETSPLSFMKNFPFSKTKIYTQWAIQYFLITLPETIFLFTGFEIKTALTMVLFNIATGMLFRNFLYVIALDMKRYIYWVFYLFIAFFLFILADMIWVFIPINFIISIVLFSKNYYHQKDFIKT